MRSSALLVVAAATVLASSVDNTWIAPLATDRRSPCPMLNTLANHGFLPRNGFNVSMAELKQGLLDAVHLDPAATDVVGGLALPASTTGHPDTFHLDDLSRHGFLEHDGSLSRADTATGNNHAFDPALWADTLAQLGAADIISVPAAAALRAHALRRAAAANPAFNVTEGDLKNSFIESSLYLSVFGNTVDGNAVTRHVRVMFEEERLAYAEGFTRPAEPISAQAIVGLVNKLAAVQV